jgi:hypothetical protein
MSEYPNTSPWGPHGPQLPAHSVTPNPTASTPDPASSWSNPSPSYDPNTMAYGGPVDGCGGPRNRSIILAVVLPLLFGPLGLLYAIRPKWLILYLPMIGACAAYFWFLDQIPDGASRLVAFLGTMTCIAMSVCAAVFHNRKLKN